MRKEAKETLRATATSQAWNVAVAADEDPSAIVDAAAADAPRVADLESRVAQLELEKVRVCR